MEARFSSEVKDVITASRDHAMRLKCSQITTNHLFLALLAAEDGKLLKLLQNIPNSTSIRELRQSMDVVCEPTGDVSSLNNIPLTRDAEDVLKRTYLVAKELKSEVIGTEHLALSLWKIAKHIVHASGVTYEQMLAEVLVRTSNGWGSPTFGEFVQDSSFMNFPKTTEMYPEKPLKDWLKPEGVQYIPYQKCPVCDGSGRVYINNFEQSTIVTIGWNACHKCGGSCVIPMHVQL